MIDLIDRSAAFEAVGRHRRYWEDAQYEIMGLPAIGTAVKVKPLVWEPMGGSFFATDDLFNAGVVSKDPAAYDAERSSRILAALDVTRIDLAQIRADAELAGYRRSVDEVKTEMITEAVKAGRARGLREALDRFMEGTAPYHAILALIDQPALSASPFDDQPAPDPVAKAARVLLDSLTRKPETGDQTSQWARAYCAMSHPGTSWFDFAAALRAIAEGQPE